MFQRIKQFFLKKDEGDAKLLKNLSELFINSPEEGISQAKIYLMSPNFTNYDEFIEDVKKTQKSNCCIVSWYKQTLSARCLDCQKEDNSCICIPCYLAGKHDQHHSYLLGGSGSGNCDCGDPNFWKSEGNCPNHPGPDPNPEITQMTEENRIKFIKVFEIAYNAALTTNNDAFSIQIFDWISTFISFGDGLRRCVSIAVTETPEEVFFTKLPKLEIEPYKSLINLFGKLISDRQFSQKIGQITLKNYLSLREQIRSQILLKNYNKKSIPFRPIRKYLSFSFHFFNEAPLMYMINEYNFDWISFLIKTIDFIFSTLKQTDLDFKKNNDGQIVVQFWHLTKMIEIFVKKDEQHDNIQKFINQYSSLLLKYEDLFYFTFPKEPEDESEKPFSILFIAIYLYQFNCVLSPLKDEVSPQNKTFLLDETFSNLLLFLNSQKNLKPDSIYGENKVLISPFLPLHHLFFCLLSSYKNPTEILSELCQKKKISLQDFCCLSSIYPLRFLTAISVPERFYKLNESTFRMITYCLERPVETFNILFGLIQTMLKAAPDKEQFLSMILKTFGAFDHFDKPQFDRSDSQRLMQMLLDYNNQFNIQSSTVLNASIFIISLITDNSISTFNKVLFKRLRVIELLMNTKPTARDIENYVNDKLNNPIFGDDLQSFAERVSTSKESFFRLKDDQNEFTPFFPLIARKNRMKIIMKYNNKLIPIPQFNAQKCPSMISCFSSPSFIASMFNLLVDKQTTFKQVGLAMFVLAARNGPKYDFSNENQDQETIKIDSISTLIQELKNKVNDKNFNPFLMNIEQNDDDGNETSMSIISAVQSMQKIGLEAFEKTDLPDFLRPKMAENEDEIQREKKTRASNLKQALLKEFQNKRSQFTMGGQSSKRDMNGEEDENDDDEQNEEEEKMNQSQNDPTQKNDSSEIMCNICQTNVADDILGFPCLSLPFILPSLINNKLHNIEIDLDNLESVFSMSICLHHVHRKCCMNLVKESDNEGYCYHCMIDRGVRNCFLPLFPNSNDFTTETSEALTEAVDSFMEKAFFNNQDDEIDPTIPIKSYAGVVLTIEVRHRSRPECLDSPTVPALLRNMLHTFYRALHGKVTPEQESKLNDPLAKLVFMMLNSDSPKNEFRKFVKQIAVSLNDDDYLYEFLRRAAIIEDFALKGEIENNSEKEPKFIDWDEILSFECLIERYEIEGKDIEKMIELPLFETIPLAERFVSLYQPPYNLDIFDNSYCKFVDLLTGTIVFYSKNEYIIPENPEIQHVTDYVSEKYHGGLAMFLALTGPNASDIIISCSSIHRLFNLAGFYVDQFGDIDPGFKRGVILSLSKDRLENSLDKLLSGDVILY